MAKTIIIDANSGPQYYAHLRECWERKDLIALLSLRDIRVRYTQTALGLLWAVINPLIYLVILLFVFTIVARVNTFGIPAALFTVSGLCVWNYFAKVISDAGSSIVGAQSLVKKIYFPRLIIPISKAISALVDLGIVMVFLFILLFYYRTPVTVNILFLIPCILMLFMIGLGGGIWIAALTIRYRDFHYIVPVLLRIGIFISPIAYGSQVVPANYQWLISLNPLTGIIDAFRWSLFDIPMNDQVFFTSLAVSIVLLVSGLIYFIRMEKYLADII